MEKLIFIIAIVVISALHSWWKRRHGESEEEDQPWPGPSRRPTPPPRRPPGAAPAPAPPPAPAKTTDWEEELRRLLQGETAAPRPAPPPPVIVARPPPLPTPPVVAPPRRPAAPPPFLARTQIPVPEEGQEQETGLAVKMPTLESSAQAFLRARTLDARVADRLKQVEQAVVGHQRIEAAQGRRAANPMVMAWLRDRAAQRGAIAVSVVLGPPKALEQ